MKKLIIVLVLATILVCGCMGGVDKNYCKKTDSTKQLSASEAREIALGSDCVKEGKLKGEAVCNENTGTWWIEIDTKKEGCSPACVIDTELGTAEINWRCTGLKQ